MHPPLFDRQARRPHTPKASPQDHPGPEAPITSGLKHPQNNEFYASMRPRGCQRSARGRTDVADVRIQDGIIRVTELDIQDAKAASVLAEYPEARWAEITRRAIKIGLGYLKGGGAQD